MTAVPMLRRGGSGAVALFLALALSGCAAGSGSGPQSPSPPYEFFVPAPLPPAAPAPPPPLVGPDLVTPALTQSAANAGASGAVYPLVVTAVGPNFSGDETTTRAGATLRVDAASGERFLTINNQAMGVTNTRATFPQGTRLADGRGLWMSAGNWDYASFGSWIVEGPIGPPTTLATGLAVWVGGAATALGDIPVTGKAAYSGQVQGQFDYGLCRNCIDYLWVSGDVRLTADFASRTLSGAMTNLGVWLDVANDTAPYGAGFPVNDIGFTATLDSSRNLFTGTTHVTSDPGGRAALKPDATGAITGQFYGPAAHTVGAAWTISDGVHRVMGVFLAK